MEPQDPQIQDEQEDPPRRQLSANAAIQYFKELVIFLAGLLLGFFWYMYFSYEKGAEVHIIIGLIVIIICLARYIALLKQ